jgi:hypothetical protein
VGNHTFQALTVQIHIHIILLKTYFQHILPKLINLSHTIFYMRKFYVMYGIPTKLLNPPTIVPIRA